MIENPLFYLQYTGGNSRPHNSPDKTKGWGELFDAQCLVEEQLEGLGTRQVVMKTSEISPTGVMIVEAAPKNRKQLRNVGNLSTLRAHDHLTLVGKTMQALQEINPDAQVYLWHINATSKPPYGMPSDFGNPRTGTLTKSSQTVGTIHSHCDALKGRGEFQAITSLQTLREAHLAHLKKEGVDKEKAGIDVHNFVEERRRLIKPRVFHKFFTDYWQNELAPHMTRTYPNLFEELENGGSHQDLPLPPNSIKLKNGYESFNNPQFAEAVQFIHKDMAAQWQEFAKHIKQLAKLYQEEKADEIDEAISGFIEIHPWAEKYEERFKILARIIEPDRRKVRDRANWLHREFNFTQGVVQWNGEPAVFFVNPTPDINAGVESVNIHPVRVPHELSPEEIEQRIKFRVKLIKALRTSDSSLKLGPEGAYTLKQYRLPNP